MSTTRFVIILIIASLVLPLLQAQPAHAQDDKTWLLNQINALRGQLGLHAYVWQGQLAAAAQEQSEYMAATGHISHTQSNGSTPGSRAAAHGYTGSFVSENIYGGTIATASNAWTWWLNSPIHYAGITHSRNNEIGIGVASGAYGNFFTLVFGYNSGFSAPPASGGGNPGGGDTSGGGNPNPNPALTNAPPVVYVPPSITPSPTPTIPTQTPTVTWTPTATWTPSPTTTEAPATSTPIQLPTAAVVVAQVPSATLSPLPPVRVAQNDSNNNAPPALTGSAGLPQDKSNQGDDHLLALLLGGLAILGIGLLFMGYGIYNMTRTDTNPSKE